jgi:hypothetical protein
VNSIHPGWVNTKLSRGAPLTTEFSAKDIVETGMETGTLELNYKKNGVVIKKQTSYHIIPSCGLFPTLIEIRSGKVSLRMLDKSNKK